MADTSIYEVTRQTHEEIERYTQAAVDLLTSSNVSDLTKEPLRKQHKLSSIVDRIISRYATLNNIYVDASGDLKNESLALSGNGTSIDQSEGGMDEFYNRLNRIRDYHKKYPNAMPDSFNLDFANNVDPETGLDILDRMFTGEEMGGKFIDLYVQHDNYLNLKGVRRISYLQYLDSFDKVRGESSRIPNEVKRSEAYRKYLEDLQSYLLNFLRRTRPLSDIDALEIEALANFEQEWSESKVEGWEDQGESVFGNSSKKQIGQQNNSSDGIWCESCRRSFAKQTVFDAHLKGQKHLKAVERQLKEKEENAQGDSSSKINKGESSEAQELERRKRRSRAKAIARDETVIIALGKELQDVRAETRANVERKAALTDRERQAEAEALSMASTLQDGLDGEGNNLDNDEDDDEERIYNPLKLPLGYDGRPIPFWLYKLHGLGIEFKCEICSDYIYQGRKNFERHFSESRHAFGMRALGLPNTKHFYEITKIQDALTLVEKLKKQGKIVAEEQGDAEEVEDEYGNTYTRKTYELLKRQGLI